MPVEDKYIDTLPEFVLACEGRPRVVIPNNQFIWGSRRHPFRIGATLNNAAVTSSDLTTHDSWYEDVQVRTAYTPTDGATTKLRAVVSIEAVRLLIANGTHAALPLTTKLDGAAGLSVRIDIGGVTKRIDLRDSVRELAREFQQTQAAAANGTFGVLKGDWAEVGPGSISVDLEVHTMMLESTNAVTYGAAINSGCWLEIMGHMVPKGTPGAQSYLPGGSSACGPHGNFALGGVQQVMRVSGLPALRGIAING